MKKIRINDSEYELVKNEGDCFNYDELVLKATDYFADYDYIFADYAYEKIRLKGFYESTNKKVTKINDIASIDDYILNYCAYGAKHFLLKKLK